MRGRHAAAVKTSEQVMLAIGRERRGEGRGQGMQADRRDVVEVDGCEL